MGMFLPTLFPNCPAFIFSLTTITGQFTKALERLWVIAAMINLGFRDFKCAQNTKIPSAVFVFLHYLWRIYLIEIYFMTKLPIWCVDTLLKQREMLKDCDSIISVCPKTIGNHIWRSKEILFPVLPHGSRKICELQHYNHSKLNYIFCFSIERVSFIWWNVSYHFENHCCSLRQTLYILKQ